VVTFAGVTRKAHVSWASRLAWLPIPLLLAAVAALWATGPHAAHEASGLTLAINLSFSTLASLLVVILLGQSFVARGTPALLLLGCGTLLWGAAGTIAPALVGQGVNAMVTVHNVVGWCAALCSLAGALSVLGSRRTFRRPGQTLAVGYACALLGVWWVTAAALRGWTPVFFASGTGGTTIRFITLGSAAVLFALTTAVLWRAYRTPRPAFVRWYGLALLLVATGLLGMMLESAPGDILSWTGRAAQGLGGVYMLVAAVASAREEGEWRASLSAALRGREDTYRMLFENMSDGFALYELLYDERGEPTDWRVLEVNDAYERHTGVPRDQIVGRRISELFPAAVPVYLPRFAAVVRTHVATSFETSAGPLGRCHHVVTFPAGEHRFASLIEDITERKKAEEELRASRKALADLAQDAVEARNEAERVGAALQASEQRMQQALLAGHGFTFEWAPATDRVLRSDSCGAILGLAGDEARHDTGQRYFQRVHPDDRQRFEKVLEGLTPAASSFKAEYRVVADDGRVVSLEETGQAAFDAEGRLERLVGVSMDISARKQAEEALRESESFHRQALQSVPGMTFTTRPDGYCDYQSQQWVDFTGVPMEDHLGDGWNKLLHPDDRPRAYEAWRAAVEGRAPYDLEYRVRRRDGVYEWFKVRGRPIRDASGAIVRWFGTAVNVDDMVRAEAKIRASLAEKEVLLKEVHHRVKNNLQIVASLVNLQLEDQSDPALLALLGDVRDRVRTMALVHERLYQSADLAGIEFDEYAHCLLNDLWRMHGSSGSSVRLRLDLQPLALSIERAVPCGLILNELASNALKHAFRGGTGGDVSVALHAAGDGRVTLQVSDTGTGLPPGLDWRQTKSLGLRLVQMLSTQLGGTVEAHPVVGGGANFVVQFNR
jgi:PAS domain S-box-containing protein